MNKEALEKIAWANERLPLAKWIYRRDHWDSPNRWKSLSDSEQERYCFLADEIIHLCSCHKIKDKPPLLSDEDIDGATFYLTGDADRLRATAKAQRELDIKHYEEE